MIVPKVHAFLSLYISRSEKVDYQFKCSISLYLISKYKFVVAMYFNKNKS